MDDEEKDALIMKLLERRGVDTYAAFGAKYLLALDPIKLLERARALPGYQNSPFYKVRP